MFKYFKLYCKDKLDRKSYKGNYFNEDYILTNDDYNFLENVISCCQNGYPENSFKINFNDFYTQMGLFYKALCLGIIFLFRLSKQQNSNFSNTSLSYLDFMKEAINLGGDTDTNACIIGGILGSYFGSSNLPDNLISILLKFNPKLDKITKQSSRPAIVSPGLILLYVVEEDENKQISKEDDIPNNQNRNNELTRPNSVAKILKFLLSKQS